ncbi:hypothetical protein [Streptomyces sp. NPDC057702]|uniref:hypothetical protein n=1 Tax=unclassified Streptomyces TaxID=2593676 RepID=UPI0036C9949E
MVWEQLDAPGEGGRGALWFSPPPERRPLPALLPPQPRWTRLLTGLITGAVATLLLFAAGNASGEEREARAPRVGGGHAHHTPNR